MGVIETVALIASPVAFLLIATSFGDGPNWRRLSLAAALMLFSFIFANDHWGVGFNGDCYVDWDGRSNRTVCD